MVSPRRPRSLHEPMDLSLTIRSVYFQFRQMIRPRFTVITQWFQAK